MKRHPDVIITAHQAKIVSQMLRGYAELMAKIEFDKNDLQKQALIYDEIADAGELSGYLKQMAKA